MRKTEAVVFDMDGVIFDSERLCLDGWKILAEREGLSGIEEVCARCIGTTSEKTEEILRAEYGENLDIERLHEELKEIVRAKIRTDGLPVKKGAKEIFESLKARGIKLAIASSTRRQTVCSHLKNAGFFDYFSVIIGGDMIEKSKPEPDIYLAACKGLNVLPQNAAAIEESFNGIRSAKAAGITTVMVPDLVKPDEEILRYVDFLCEDLIAARDEILGLTE
jgi:HAD superfamily hydrolase (TIGR01509 family)